jgi:hypothetical protein
MNEEDWNGPAKTRQKNSKRHGDAQLAALEAIMRVRGCGPAEAMAILDSLPEAKPGSAGRRAVKP